MTFLSFLLIYVATTEIKVSSSPTRSIKYENIQPNRRLLAQPVARYIHTGMSMTHCSMLCSTHKHCLSFNFCGKQTCLLYEHDVATLDVAIELFPGCTYVGMRNVDEPSCSKEINSCEIGFKLLGEMGPWFTNEIDNDVEYKVARFRSVCIFYQKRVHLKQVTKVPSFINSGEPFL